MSGRGGLPERVDSEDGDPPYLYEDYPATRLRAPKRPLLVLPEALAAITGAVFGSGAVGERVALGHPEEPALHVRAALRNGMTADEIKEALLQTPIDCGVPAANSAFAIAQGVLEDA